MALMLTELYDALRAAGADEEKARRAAEAVAGYDSTIAGVRTEIRVVQAVGAVIVVVLLATIWQLFGLRGEVSALRADMSGLTTQVGTLRQEIVGLRDSLAARLTAIEQKLPSGR